MFTAANAAALGQLGGTITQQQRKARKPRKSTRYQILELKDVAFRDAVNDETPVGVKASLMRAYVDLHEIDMATRGIGKPRPVDAVNAVPKRKQRATVSPIARVTPQSSEPASDASSTHSAPVVPPDAK